LAIDRGSNKAHEVSWIVLPTSRMARTDYLTGLARQIVPVAGRLN
jgi:hypothetical protein